MMRRRQVVPLALAFAGLLGISCIVGLDTYPKMSQAINFEPPKHQLCTVTNRDPSRWVGGAIARSASPLPSLLSLV